MRLVLPTAPDIAPSAPELHAKAYLYASGEEAYRERVLTLWARSGSPEHGTAWRERLTLPGRWQPPKLPLGGADVVALGVAPGPRVGELLRALESWWIAGGFAADEGALRARLQQMVAQA